MILLEVISIWKNPNSIFVGEFSLFKSPIQRRSSLSLDKLIVT